MTEEQLLRALNATVHQPEASRVIANVAQEVSELLVRDFSMRLTWRPIPLEVYGRLPVGIASSWVFVLRRNCSSGAERHPNSIQRVMSLNGAADLQTWNGRMWVSNVLTSEPSAPLHQRWLSIPANVWHRPVMGDEHWTVVSFHTALDDALVEERAYDDENPGRGGIQEPYAGRTAR
jgi:hypothetical protein